jgi:hypothetical protein
MLKNPNGYFYRHCEPGEAQAAGGWTEAEVDLFVRVAERWGAGDKWGLFSSHIPKRVGYQCSAVYRQVSAQNCPAQAGSVDPPTVRRGQALDESGSTSNLRSTAL